MKKMYTIWTLDHWDESIEENNVVGECLTRKFAQQEEDLSNSHFYRVWVSGKHDVDMDYILSHLWCKEEVDDFVANNPETGVYTFKIYKPYTPDDHNLAKGYLEYRPISAIREELLKSILDEN